MQSFELRYEILPETQAPREVQGFFSVTTVTAIEQSAANLTTFVSTTMILTDPTTTTGTTAAPTTTTLPVGLEWLTHNLQSHY